MRTPVLPPALVTPFHGFAILSGTALLASLLWPEPVVGRSLFLQILVFLQGVLALQTGEAERGYGVFPPGQRVLRLLFFTAAALALAVPFLLIHRTETGIGWREFLLSLAFLMAHGFAWTSAGYALPGVIRSEGLRFMIKYGGLTLVMVVLVFFLPFGSGIFVLPALWEGRGGGWPGLALYLSLGGLSALWMGRRPRRS